MNNRECIVVLYQYNLYCVTLVLFQVNNILLSVAAEFGLYGSYLS